MTKCIDNLTLGEIKELMNVFGAHQGGKAHPFVGRYVIARCYAAGVHAGEVVSVDGGNVMLKNSTRLWSWKAQDGIALSGVAQHGIKKDSKLDTVNPEIYLVDVCEIIPCTEKAKGTINDK